MPQFNVDEDLAALVERLAEPKPFEHLSFNSALRRVLTRFGQIVAEMGIPVHRDRPFRYRDRSFRLNVTGHSGLS